MRFLLVDKIYELEPGIRIKASKTMPATEELFRDHFPGFPVVPGVLLTEMMAQAAGKCLLAQGTHPGRPILTKISNSSFRAWVRPDEEAIIFAEIVNNRPEFANVTARIEVAGKRVCSAELFFVFAPHELFTPGYRDEVLDAFLRERTNSPAEAT